jgi:hypothetical protein
MTTRRRDVVLRCLIGSAVVWGGIGSAPGPLRGQDTTALYQQGYKAYQGDDFIQALKYLFAYRQIAVVPLPTPPKIGPGLDAALAYSEDKLDLAVRTRQALDKYGQITEVQVSAGGKMDADGKPLPPVKVHLPAAGSSRKPSISPPGTAVAKAEATRPKARKPVRGAEVAAVKVPAAADASNVTALEQEKAGLLARVAQIDAKLAELRPKQ